MFDADQMLGVKRRVMGTAVAFDSQHETWDCRLILVLHTAFCIVGCWQGFKTSFVELTSGPKVVK